MLTVAIVAMVAVCTCGGGSTSPTTNSTPTSNLLSVGGSYPTQVSLVAGQNTCGAVTIQDNVTTVTHTAGAHVLSLTHVGNTYQGTVDDGGHFSTTPSTLSLGESQFTIAISGQFSQTGFNATVKVDVKQPTAPLTCSYVVTWLGTKQGTPNTIPGS